MRLMPRDARMEMTLTPSRRPVTARLALFVLSGLVLVGLCVAVLDRPVATWSHDVLHRAPAAVAITKLAAFQLCMEISGAALAGALAMRLIYGRLSQPWRTAMAAASATILAAFAVMLLKHAFGRLWPETWINHNPSWIGTRQYGFMPFHGGEGWGSFPSGHTARITAPFAVLWHRVRRWRIVWVMPPAVIAAALIACDYHFLGDCVGGAYVGIASAGLVLMVL
jgi:membrane-associated phospholipid phosphatase